MELFPAVIIGGPPDNGKSVLTANLTQVLRERGVPHYVLRACPDGEGDWTLTADQELVRTILVPMRWTPTFVEHVCGDLERRPLPLIVDVGGRPQPWQEIIFDHCTHAILLTPDEASNAIWLDRVRRHGLILMADIRSDLDSQSRLTERRPVLRGVLAGLERGARVRNPVFDTLAERLIQLFFVDVEELRQTHLDAAPVETVIDLDRLAHTLNVSHREERAIWKPHHLRVVLDYLPEGVPLGLYGRGSNWLYAAGALLAHPPARFYQFDVRLGWVEPPTLRPGEARDDAPLRTRRLPQADHVHLAFTIDRAYLDYTEAKGLVVPPVQSDRGLVISGKLPLWLYTALCLAYAPGVPWIAVYQPQEGDRAIVVGSHHPELAVGDQVISPPPRPAEARDP